MGYEGFKKLSSRKRRILKDIIGFIIAVAFHAENIQDRDGAKQLLTGICEQFARLMRIPADAFITETLPNG